MAEISDAELAQFNEALSNVVKKFGGLDLAVESLRLRLTEGYKVQRDNNEAYKRLMRERKKEEDNILTQQRKGSITYKEAAIELQRLNDRVREVVPPEMRREFENYIDNQNRANIIQLTSNRILNSFNKEIQIAGQVISGLGTAASKLLGAYTSGENDIKMAGSTTQAAASLFFGATGGVGKALSAMGEAAMGAAPFFAETGPLALGVGAAGLALTGLGKIVDYSSQQLNELAQKAIPVLTAEVDKLYQSFNAISSTGAVFVNGINAMNTAALGVNLTLPEFADVLKQNSSNLALLGQSVTQAAQRMGEVGTTMRRSGVSMELQRLGYTFKEQAGLIADTMGLMRQSGGSLTSSNAEVAQQTAKYAENLRIISSITGEDAKKKEQQVKDEANQLAFQQKLAGMDEKQRLGVISAMENMSDAQRKAFMEVTVFGQAITPASAYMMSNLSGFGDSVNRAAAEFQAGTLDGESMRRTNAEFGAAMKADLLASVDLARAGMAGVGGLAGDLEKIFGKELQFRNVFTEDAVNAARAAVDAQKQQAEGATDLTGKMLLAANAGRDMALTIQQAVLDSNVLETFAGTIAFTTEQIVKVIKEFTNQSSTFNSQTERNARANEDQHNALEKLVASTLDIGAMIYTLPAKYLFGADQSLTPAYDALIREGGQARTTSPVTSTQNNSYLGGFGRGQAEGGLMSGPSSGYLAKLHGTEAVLPENLTELLTDAANSAQAVKDQMPFMNVRPDRSEEMIATLNSKFDDMISLLDDISSHTERTSVRVA